jgi:guanylate kinase
VALSSKPSSPPGDHRSIGSPGGRLFIVSAPSGAGKSTLCTAVRRHLDGLAYSVSYTTRPPRRGERPAVDYHFISESEFRQGIDEGRWAEWARVHGNYYGTSARWIEETLNSGRDILLDIDLQGARQMVRRFPDAVTIFIMPPSLAELERRLRQRDADSQQDIELRLSNAREEIAQRHFCRHELINDEIGKATRALVDLIAGYREGASHRSSGNVRGTAEQ